MDKVVAKKDFSFNGVDYLANENVKVKNFEEVVKLNTLGFIKPLTSKDLTLIERELKKENKKNKEVKDEL